MLACAALMVLDRAFRSGASVASGTRSASRAEGASGSASVSASAEGAASGLGAASASVVASTSAVASASGAPSACGAGATASSSKGNAAARTASAVRPWTGSGKTNCAVGKSPSNQALRRRRSALRAAAACSTASGRASFSAWATMASCQCQPANHGQRALAVSSSSGARAFSPALAGRPEKAEAQSTACQSVSPPGSGGRSTTSPRAAAPSSSAEAFPPWGGSSAYARRWITSWKPLC